jgi:hypothetical protein
VKDLLPSLKFLALFCKDRDFEESRSYCERLLTLSTGKEKEEAKALWRELIAQKTSSLKIEHETNITHQQ